MFELLFEPPINRIQGDFLQGIQTELYIKREDLLHPFVSGNKWRKLKYVLEDARLKKKNELVSFGGAYSNHLLALACAGAMYGFTTRAFVRGEEVNNYMLGLCKVFGMNLQFVSREDYREKKSLYETYYGKNTGAYFIDEGGKGKLAMKGCEEILENVRGYSHIVCAVGTGTTVAGLAKAAKQKNMKAEGICVLKGAEEINGEIEDMAGFPVKIHHQFHRNGYAKTDSELMDFIQLFATQTGILLDPIYTAKLMMGVLELIRAGYYAPTDKILVIHTGGLLGALSKL